MNLNQYVPDSLIPILTCFPTYETSIKFSKLFYENYKSLPQHKVLFDEYVVYTRSPDLGDLVYKSYKSYKRYLQLISKVGFSSRITFL